MATMEGVRSLITKKDEMEKEMKDSLKYLEEVGVGMTGHLVDTEGYPRADLDLYAIRSARQRVNCLQNDLRALIREIEQQLHLLHGSSENGDSASGSQGNGHSQDAAMDEPMDAGNEIQPAPHRTSNTPFLKIDQIAPGSPASNAGLVNDDIVIQFGSLCHTNFTQMDQVAEIVKNTSGRPIRLTVLRDYRPVRLSLTPKRWDGQGLLGCRVSPFRG